MMRRHWICTLFALTWLFFAGSSAQEDTELGCDDKIVQDVVDLILQKYNKNLTEGRQMALFQVLEASKTKNESVEILTVSFTVRESDCPAAGEKLWSECEYVPPPAKLLFCNGKVLLKETNEVLSQECSAETQRRASCLGCPMSINVDSEDLKESLSYSLARANLMHNHPHHFILNSVGSATKQVIAGFRYRLRFDMQKSNCSKSEFKEVTKECHPDENEKAFINCNSTVDVAPWRHELPETQVQCGSGPLPGDILIIRRRPPGWSPLRNVHNFAVVPPKKPPKKGESSEEAVDSKVPSTAPTEAPGAVPPPKPSGPEPVAPPKCPSKPWKTFNELGPGGLGRIG